MANRLSNVMAGRHAVPPVNTPQALGHFKQYALLAENPVLAADADGLIMPVTRLKSHWRIMRISYWNSGITGGTVYRLGLYRAGDWSAGDQTAIDDDCYVTNVTLAAQATVPIVAATGVAMLTDRIWALVHQDANGLAAAAPTPGTEYDLCWTAGTVGTADGYVRTLIEYCADY